MKAHIRVIAIGIFMHEARMLVLEGRDPYDGRVFYRPLGGGVEFGERGSEALARELHEELGTEIVEATYVGTLENIFTYNSEPHHEIVLVYRARFVDAHVYDVRSAAFHEHDGTPFLALWRSLDAFRRGGPPLYPDGLLAMLTGATKQP